MSKQELNAKQKNFADNYIETGNAYKSAINAGYAESTAKSRTREMLERPAIKEYIDARMAELDSLKIMDQKEVLELLSSIARGEKTEQTLIGIGEGYQDITDIDVSMKDRIKAAELIGKRHGMWTDKVDLSGNVELIFEDDYGDEDD